MKEGSAQCWARRISTHIHTPCTHTHTHTCTHIAIWVWLLCFPSRNGIIRLLSYYTNCVSIRNAHIRTRIYHIHLMVVCVSVCYVDDIIARHKSDAIDMWQHQMSTRQESILWKIIAIYNTVARFLSDYLNAWNLDFDNLKRYYCMAAIKSFSLASIYGRCLVYKQWLPPISSSSPLSPLSVFICSHSLNRKLMKQRSLHKQNRQYRKAVHHVYF